jgi:membrane protein required for colicin V production
MLWVDYVIIGIIALSALIGLARGLIREVISIGVWIAAAVAAWLFYAPVAAGLEPWIRTPSLQIAAAVLIIVVGVLIAGALFAWLLTTLVDKTGLSGTDRLLGVVFGAGRGAILVALLVLLASLTPLTEDAWWGESQLLGTFRILADWMLAQVPPEALQRVRAL